jgi:hypothetical protein
MLTAALLAFAAFHAKPVMNPSVPTQLTTYDVIWNTPSRDAAGSMPIGNGEVVLNVWVEDKTGDLMFLIGRTDSLSEICRMLKLGRVRVHLEPSPFRSSADFRQHLRLHDGRIDISGGGTSLKLYVDSASNVISVSGESVKPVSVAATLECWRNAPRTLPADEQQSAWSVHDAPFALVESSDVFPPNDPTGVTWYHRNETSIVPKVLANQSLTGLPGTFDPLIHRTFGGRLSGPGFVRQGDRSIGTAHPATHFQIWVTTHTAQTPSVAAWLSGLPSPKPQSSTKTRGWWHSYWSRSWVLVDGDQSGLDVPRNGFPMRKGKDSNGQNLFPGEMRGWQYEAHPLSMDEIKARAKTAPGGEFVPSSSPQEFDKGFSLQAWIRPDRLEPGRIFDKITAGGTDGFLFDMQTGGALRLIVGDMTIWGPKQVRTGVWQHVAATYDARTGSVALYLNGVRVAGHESLPGSSVTRGYVLQRYVQACQGRGEYPIKFNGGTYTVEPTAMGRNFNPDWRNWGDCHWYQNVRHMYHPMLESGDFEMMEPFFRLYESSRPLAESRTKLYHHATGAYFPETMTVFGTYSGGDYGWNRAGKQPKDVDCQYWQYAWNQGPELVNLMLDYWDYTRDESFLEAQLLPMAKSVLEYFDTRFGKDRHGQIVLSPTQVVETYWHGVTNDMPTTSGLISIAGRLCALPQRMVTPELRDYFVKMKAACPDLPVETKDGKRQLAPAQQYDNDTSNVENGQLYGVWPSRVVSLAHPKLLAEAKTAYANRLNHLDVGWGYDGNVAALLGMTEEAARILRVKCGNSNPEYRWPATWGPNFDWLPDQNHGGNLLNTANLMLLQSEPIEAGGAIRLLPAWPQKWNVDFKLCAPGRTSVHCVVQGGKIKQLVVTPASRRKDVILPGWAGDKLNP